MNRRGFLKFLSQATLGAGVVYSFPSIIVPKNIEKTIIVPGETLFYINTTTFKELYPSLIRDMFFQDTPLLAYLKEKHPYFGDAQFRYNPMMVFTDVEGIE